ncbi:MAG: hypothetical protein WCP03_01340 [Candidatus Saccharibacteria bacterium]
MKQNNSQSGLASIMFTMFMVIVISLLAIGFAVLVRNDQRQTLDKTLSNQAQYAAEAAINMKQRKLTDDPTAADPVNVRDNKDDCFLDKEIVKSPLIDELPGVQVTCLTWTSTPKQLIYNNVGLSPVSVPIKTTRPITQLFISWKTVPPQSTSAKDNNLMLQSNENSTLRIVYMANEIKTPSNPNDEPKTAFLQPSTVANNSKFLPNDNGYLSNITCTNDGTCSTDIVKMITPPGHSGGGRLAISSLNGKSNITITAFNGNCDNCGLPFKDAQVAIDATAKSQDVIRRLKAYMPLERTTWHPNAAAVADRLCKNYRTDGSNNDSVSYPPMVSNDYCQP